MPAPMLDVEFSEIRKPCREGLVACLRKLEKMFLVATIRFPENTACGVRWAFVVIFACLSNLAVAGVVPAGSGVSLEMHSALRTSHWLSSFLGRDLLYAGGSTESGAMGESSSPAQPLPDFPQKSPFFLSLAAVLGNGGDFGSTGSSSVGPRTMSHSSLLPSDAIRFAPPLVSRLDADEDLRLPLKLPYKLFRPPKLLVSVQRLTVSCCRAALPQFLFGGRFGRRIAATLAVDLTCVFLLEQRGVDYD
jgi:hypothetical protein